MGFINYDELENDTPALANDINERFGEVVRVVNGGLDSTNFKEGGIPSNALSSDVYERIYPIGSVYINATNNANPSTLLGFGTWVAFGAGRVPVGIDTSQTEFNSPEKTGGHKALQSHTHTGNTNTTGAHSHTTTAQVAVRTSSTVGLTNLETDQFSWGNVGTDTQGNHSHSFTTNSSGSGDSGNLQPYITVYMWKRTG